MKKIIVFAIELIALAQLVSCNSTLSSVSVNSSEQTATKSFTQWCQQQNSVSPGAKIMIDLLLKEADTKDCKLADARLSKLTNLDLYHSEISDVTPLESFKNLTSLDLIGNQITNISPLAKLSNLNFLSLGKNQISDIKPLAKLSKLTFLGLRGNKIRDIQPLAKLDELVTLSVEDNQIADKTCPMKSDNICAF